MATVDKNFKVKNGLIVGDSTNLVNYTSASPSDPFVGQLWIDSDEDSPLGDLSAYLTLVGASATYLRQNTASATYLIISASSNFLPTSASSNFLPTSASINYLRIDTASATYLRQDTASAIYLRQDTASSTYLRQDSASASYLQISASSNYLPVSASINYLRTDNASATYSTKLISTNAQTGTSYVVSLSDADKLIEMNNANDNTIIIPTNASVAFPVGTKIDFIQTGAGATSASPTSGVTLNSDTNKRTINTQWAVASLVKRGTDTWLLIGALKA